MTRRSSIVLVMSALLACDEIPGTEAYKHKTSIEAAQVSAAYKLIDPSSAQFRNVTVTNDFACGEVNGRNRMGAYAGFLRFTATREKEKWTAELDPQFDEERFKQARRDCQIAGSTHNAALAQLSCREAMEMTVEQMPQFAFDQRWDMLCKGK